MQIARDLKMDEILAPSVYWQQKDVIHKQKYTNLWEGTQIKNILQNPIYTGDVQIAKTKKCYYKGITSAMRRDDGYYVEDHHEAIIDHGTFDKAQEMLKAKRKEYFSTRGKNDGIKNKKPDYLQGILYCGHCGNKMNMYRRTIKLVSGVGHYSTYVCKRSAAYGPEDPAKNVKAEDMEGMILELIKQHIAIYVEVKDRLKILNRKPVAEGKKAELKDKLSSLKSRKEKVEGFIRNLYGDFTEGIFSETEYLEMKTGYVSELDALDADMEETENMIETYSAAYGGNAKMATTFSKYIGVNKLNRELVVAFIAKITCYSKMRFEVEYTFSNELKEFMDLVEKRGDEVA